MSGEAAREPASGRLRSAAGAALMLAAALAVCRIPLSAPPGLSRAEADLLGLIARQRGAEATARARDLVATNRQTHGPRSTEAADAMDTFVRVVATTGNAADLPEALAMAREAIAIRERVCGTDCPGLAASLEAYGYLLWSHRQYHTGLPVAERDVAIRTRVSGPESPETGASLYFSADFNRALGNYAAARRLYEQAIRVWEAAPGDHAISIADATHYLGILRWILGDLAGARELLERALSLREGKAMGLGNERVASETNSLGNLAWAMGQRSRAMALFDKAQAVWARTMGERSPQVALSLESKGRFLAASGDYEEARALDLRALEIRRHAFGPDDWLVGRSLAELGRIAALSGDTAEAERYFARALQIQEKDLDTGADEFASTLVDDAGLALSAGDPVRAVNLALKGEGVARETFLRTARGLGEEDALRYEAVLRSGLDVALDALAAAPSGEVPGLPGAASRIWDAVIRSRAMVLDEMAARERAAQVSTGRPGLAEVMRELPAGAALVAYKKYEEPRPASRAAAPSSYLAFVVAQGGGAPEAVPLGGAEAIETAIRDWQKEAAADPRLAPALEGERRYLEAGRRLRRLIWDPVTGAIGDRRMVFIVPDDAISLVSFASLPADDGRYLIESGPRIHYVSAERGILVPPAPPLPGGGVLALGDAAFDAPPMPVAGGEQELRNSVPSCAPFGRIRFDSLPGSRAEVQDVESLWKGRVPVLTLTGRDATEGAFKRWAQGRTILHLATHGYFLQDRCPSSLDSRPSPEGGVVIGENPLRLTGLAFAGANRRSEASGTDEDGILTAEEIAALDLSGTGWAVLSACDTGLGQLVEGEGVLGLRRAFSAAGVRTVIMALWPVDDGAARIWMRRLYEGRLAGLSTADAVSRAGLGMLAAQRESGGTTHPYFWGAFVATGDWR